MNDPLTSSRHGDIAVIVIDEPPVNTLGVGLRRALVSAIDRAGDDPGIAAIVLMGSPRAFSAGGDIDEIESPRAPPLRTVIAIIEDSDKPVIAAIDGLCLGGGLELALGCHFRLATGQARLGLPEVTLGLLPGAGGTQRLPRLLGIERSLNLIISGVPAPAARFTDTPLIDRLVTGDLLDAALAFARRIIDDRAPLPRTRERAVADENAEALLQFARNTFRAIDKGFPAPLACVDAVAASLRPFEEGMALEQAGFMSLMQSPESRALRHVLKAERAAAHIEDMPAAITPRPIQRVGVIGAGTMGTGIAMNFLNAGIPVLLLETSQAALDRGLAAIRRTYESSAAKGRIRADDVEARLALLTPTLGYEAFAPLDLVVEAVFEDMAVKQQVFTALDRVCRPGAILASNTSYLDIDRIAAFTSRPGDVLGLHFFSPANIMRLLEVVRGKATSHEVLATAMDLAARIGKIAVVARVCDGFIGNRMLARYRAAANALVDAGALPQQVDGALQAFGMAMGPFRMGDLAGLDIGWATRKRIAAQTGQPMSPSIADRLCEAGRFGQKTGAGWYRYEAGSRQAIPDAETGRIIAAFRAERGIPAREVGDREIVQRCIYALINEGARILEEGIAARASDIDIVYLNGYGFPLRHGGPMQYADTIGLPDIVRSLHRFAAEPHADPAWQPAALLDRMAGQSQSFNTR